MFASFVYTHPAATPVTQGVASAWVLQMILDFPTSNLLIGIQYSAGMGLAVLTNPSPEAVLPDPAVSLTSGHSFN